MNSTGLAPSRPCSARHTSVARGTRQMTKTTTLVHLFERKRCTQVLGSVILLQVHSGVHASDLIAVAVEHESVAAEDFAEAAFLSLAPARMVDGGIHVGIKAVFVRSRERPCGRRLAFHKFNFDDRLDAL